MNIEAYVEAAKDTKVFNSGDKFNHIEAAKDTKTLREKK